MNFKIHIPIVCLLLALQFFITDIFGVIYLPIIEYQLKKDKNVELYRSNEYRRISSEGPKDFSFVYVSKSGGQTLETFYSKEGNRTVVTSVDGKWQSTETNYLSTQAFLVLPFIGFCFGMFAILHKMARTGAMTTWTLSKYPFDSVEKVSLLYGVPLFVSAILFGWIKGV